MNNSDKLDAVAYSIRATKSRGRQRTGTKQPSIETMKDKLEASVLTDKLLLEGEISRLKQRIDKLLTGYTRDRDQELASLSDELSTLNAKLDKMKSRL